MERHSKQPTLDPTGAARQTNIKGGAKAKQKAASEALTEYMHKELIDIYAADAQMFNIFDKDGKEKLNAKKVNVYMDNAKFVSRANVALLKDLPFSGISVVKQVEADVPYDSTLRLIDLKLDVFGPKEDQYYGALPYLVKNIRRGNTLIVKEGKHLIGRKGLMKFFDMRMGFIQKEHRYTTPDISGRGGKLMPNEKNLILAPVLKALAKGHQVEVLKTLKANGENVQVSYSKEVGAWIIASKNVGLLARNMDDAMKYKVGDVGRYQFAIEMADVWFKKLATMSEKEQQELMKACNERTLVGEYIGSDAHQHLVKYSRVTIIFYAIVDNYGEDSCWPCAKAWALFKRFNLDVVHIQSLGVFTSYEKTCDAMEKVFRDVAASPIASDEEGNVLYFVKRDADQPDNLEKQRVLSLAKLKTLEYRLFRKMREKLRGYHANDIPTGDEATRKIKSLTKKFNDESQELLSEGDSDLPRPLSYYSAVFAGAFEFLKAHPGEIKTLKDAFVTFSERLLKYINETGGSGVSLESFFDSDILDRQQDIQYGADVEMVAPVTESKQIDEKDDVEMNPEVPKIVSQPVKSVGDGPKVMIVIPFAMVCTGKSHFWGVLQSKFQDKAFLAKIDSSIKHWSFKSVSSDGVRKEIMDKMMASGKYQKDDAFSQSRKQANRAYHDAFVTLLEDCAYLKPGEGRILFLDKNHPATGLPPVLDNIDKYMPRNVAHLKIYMAPEESNQLRIPNYPYSQAFMAQVLANASLRENHPTLDNSNLANSFAVCIMFLGLNRGTRFDSTFLTDNGLDDYLRLPIVKESADRQNDSEFSTYLNALIGDAGHRNEFTVDSARMPDLVEYVSKHAAEWQAFPSTAELENALLRELQRLILNHGWSGQAEQADHAEESKASDNALPESKPQPDEKNGLGAINQLPQNYQQMQIPIYVGISMHDQPDFETHFIQLVTNSFAVLSQEYGPGNDFQKDFAKLKKAMTGQQSIWKPPAGHHVTQKFGFGKKNPKSMEFLKHYEIGKKVDIVIRAVIYVPERILVGICFPKAEVDNKFPHMTMMVANGWKPVNSNHMLQATCNEGGAFQYEYQALESGDLCEQQINEAHDINVQLTRNKVEKVPRAYLIAFEASSLVTFAGATKKFFSG